MLTPTTLNAAALFVPTVAVLLGIVLNWSNNSALRNDNISLRRDMDAFRVDSTRQFTDQKDSTQKQFADLKDLMFKQFADLKESTHKDALIVLREMTALHERVAVIEAKQEGR